MREITVKPLTAAAIKVYGSFSSLLQPNVPCGGVPGMKFFPDLEQVELGDAHAASVSITQVNKKLKPVVVALEQHSRCGEGMVSLDGDMLAYFAPAGFQYPAALDHVEAFLIPKGTFVAIRPGVWHCMPFAVDTEVIKVINVLPERTYANDTATHLLKEDEQIAILM